MFNAVENVQSIHRQYQTGREKAAGFTLAVALSESRLSHQTDLNINALPPRLYEMSKSHFFSWVTLNTSSHGWFNVWINYGTEPFLLLCPATDYILMSLVCGGKDFHRILPDLNHHRGDKNKIHLKEQSGTILRRWERRPWRKRGNVQTVKMRGWLTPGQGRSGTPIGLLLWSVYQTLIWWTVRVVEEKLWINFGWWIVTTMETKSQKTDGKKKSTAINKRLQLIIKLSLQSVYTCASLCFFWHPIEGQVFSFVFFSRLVCRFQWILFHTFFILHQEPVTSSHDEEHFFFWFNDLISLFFSLL